MVRACIRLDLYQGLAILPEEEEVEIIGIGTNSKMQPQIDFNTKHDVYLEPGRSVTLMFKQQMTTVEKNWTMWLAIQRKLIPTFVVEKGDRIIGCKFVNGQHTTRLVPSGTTVMIALPDNQLPRKWGFTTLKVKQASRMEGEKF